MRRADELRALIQAIESHEPHLRTREEWLRQADRDAAAGEWLLEAASLEHTGNQQRIRDAWTKVVAQGPAALGWPVLAEALAHLGRRVEAKAAWSREARFRTRRGEWLEAAIAHSRGGEVEAEKAAWINLAVLATKHHEDSLAYTAWEMAGEPVRAAEAAERAAYSAVGGFHQRKTSTARRYSRTPLDLSWSLDSADWWETTGLHGRAKSARDRVDFADQPPPAARVRRAAVPGARHGVKPDQPGS
jgi:hypothetical protein